MFAQLPETIKRRVMEYLSSNNFVAAKQLHDEWVRAQHYSKTEHHNYNHNPHLTDTH